MLAFTPVALIINSNRAAQANHGTRHGGATQAHRTSWLDAYVHIWRRTAARISRSGVDKKRQGPAVGQQN
jgi:hypothetical protein